MPKKKRNVQINNGRNKTFPLKWRDTQSDYHCDYYISRDSWDTFTHANEWIEPSVQFYKISREISTTKRNETVFWSINSNNLYVFIAIRNINSVFNLEKSLKKKSFDWKKTNGTASFLSFFMCDSKVLRKRRNLWKQNKYNTASIQPYLKQLTLMKEVGNHGHRKGKNIHKV